MQAVHTVGDFVDDFMKVRLILVLVLVLVCIKSPCILSVPFINSSISEKNIVQKLVMIGTKSPYFLQGIYCWNLSVIRLLTALIIIWRSW